MVVVACPLLPSASSTFQPSETGSGLHKDPIPTFTSHNRCSQYHRFELQKLFGLAGTQAPDLFLTLFSCLVETIAADKAKELPHGAWAQVPTTKPTSPRSCHDHHVQDPSVLSSYRRQRRRAIAVRGCGSHRQQQIKRSSIQ
ncbi:hypothetical protein PVAP13_9KG031600 [Panicum virgatum]|uniref:Uncharacterized protein n=1 Tax=Panicum virgatum TaxID=38727 RepID=A0A8T0NEC2_PANVG|nr:hypothetical protein PVAP13_9KG031600 [Panicum virgatum]